MLSLRQLEIILVLAFATALITDCDSKSLTPVTFILPDSYEGAVVVVFEQGQGTVPTESQGSRVVEVPSSGIVTLKVPREQFRGQPSFEYKNQGSLSYLYPRKEIAPEGGKSFDGITPEQFSNQVYVMNYDEGVVNNTDKGPTRFLTFIVCKPKEGNYYASHDKSTKIAVATKIDQ